MGLVKVFQVLECGGTGGTGHQVAAICGGLDPARFDVTLVYAVREGCTPAEYEAMAKGARRFVHIPEMVREITPLSDFKAFRKLHRLFLTEKPDIVHAHSSKAGFLARTAAWAAGVARIYYSPRGYSFLQTDRAFWVRGLYRWLEWSVSWIGTVVAVSKSEGKLARMVGAKRVRVIEDAYLGSVPRVPANGVLARNEEEIVVCASGRLSFPRFPEAFVRLARRLTQARKNVRCVWIGGGEFEAAVRELVRDLSLKGKLDVTGWVPHEKALELLGHAQIFVHYSRWEGLPNSVLEAMAHGLPVVASNVVGNRDLVRREETGFLVRSEEELLKAVLALVDDPERRAAMGKVGREMIRRHYSRERLIREISSLYEDQVRSAN